MELNQTLEEKLNEITKLNNNLENLRKINSD